MFTFYRLYDTNSGLLWATPWSICFTFLAGSDGLDSCFAIRIASSRYVFRFYPAIKLQTDLSGSLITPKLSRPASLSESFFEHNRRCFRIRNVNSLQNRRGVRSRRTSRSVSFSDVTTRKRERFATNARHFEIPFSSPTVLLWTVTFTSRFMRNCWVRGDGLRK